LGTKDYAAAVAYYQRVLEPLGISLLRDTGKEAAFGTAAQWAFFLYPVEGEKVTAPGMHIALAAPSRQAVAAVHAAALEAGANDIFTPRLRPDISATYYGAMVHDLDGHRFEVLTNAA
jgi:catechol 2,3-dioxygenase-like lactoylglutathione lyase family enzyme